MFFSSVFFNQFSSKHSQGVNDFHACQTSLTLLRRPLWIVYVVLCPFCSQKFTTLLVSIFTDHITLLCLYLSSSSSLPSSPSSLCFTGPAWISPRYCSWYNSYITILFFQSLFTSHPLDAAVWLTPVCPRLISPLDSISLCFLFSTLPKTGIHWNKSPLNVYAWKIKAFKICSHSVLLKEYLSLQGATVRPKWLYVSVSVSPFIGASRGESLVSALSRLTSVWSVVLFCSFTV